MTLKPRPGVLDIAPYIGGRAHIEGVEKTFKLSSTPKPVTEFLEAREAGVNTRPVILGPVSFLYLGKADRDQTIDPISALDKLLPLYESLLKLYHKHDESALRGRILQCLGGYILIYIYKIC